MENVLGIIAEYNPFHNGHLHHLNVSKKLTNCQLSIAIISGNFTQRGSVSIVDKWQKTKMALNNGVDLVIELPVLYSISSAENFADGAVKILNSLGIVNYLSFGAETSDISLLNDISNVLFNEPDKYKKLLNDNLKQGLSFPKARENALLSYFNNGKKYYNLLSSPNNILGIEYIKALRKYNSDIIPFSIDRKEVNHNSTDLNNNFASSSTIRNFLKENDIDTIKSLVPKETFSILKNNLENNNVITDLSTFNKEILYTLRKMTIEEIANLPDVSEGLEFSIKKACLTYNNINDILMCIKSKRYTYTRLQRILLYALLDISKNDMETSKNTIPYVRVLGFNENGKKMISKIVKLNPDLKIITSVKKFIDTNTNSNLQLLLEKDILATNVYSLALNNNYFGNLDFKNNIIKL